MKNGDFPFVSARDFHYICIMRYSVVRQTPVSALVTLVTVVAVAFVRFANAPFGDEMLLSPAAPVLGAYVDAWQSAHPVWGIVLSALLTVLTGVVVGRMTILFSLYPTHCFFSIPLYGFVACGIFIAADTLAVAVAAYLAALGVRYVCGAYVRGMDLSKLLYAGVCIGLVPLFYVPASFVAVMALAAIAMFGFSLREIVVLLFGLLLGPAVVCYVTWFAGGDFTAPLVSLWEALAADSGYSLLGSDSVVALAAAGLLAFVMVCSTAMFLADKHSVGVKPRGILVYNMAAFIAACASFLLPSASVGLFAFAAIPAAIIMPIMFMRVHESLSLALYISMVLVFFLHLFVQ